MASELKVGIYFTSKNFGDLVAVMRETEIKYETKFETVENFISWMLDTQRQQNEAH